MVGEDNIAHIQNVKPLERIGTDWIVEGTLKQRTVSYEGIQKAKNGALVNPKPYHPPAIRRPNGSRFLPFQRVMCRNFLSTGQSWPSSFRYHRHCWRVSIIQLRSRSSKIAPPEIQIRTSFVGADALTSSNRRHADRTAVERVDNMNYMYSINASDGSLRL